MLAREKWEAEQQQKEAPVQVASDISQLTPAVMENTVPLNVKALLDPATREQSMVAQLTSIEGMPQIFRELIMGQFSQVSLAAFYHLAQAEFAKGATAVAVTPEFLNNMLTPSLRQRFEALARAEREG